MSLQPKSKIVSSHLNRWFDWLFVAGREGVTMQNANT